MELSITTKNVFCYSCFSCKKKTKQDIMQAIDRIDELRQEQQLFEEKFLCQFEKKDRPYKTAEIVSLYYLVRMLEVTGHYLIESKADNEDPNIEKIVNYLAERAKVFSDVSRNVMLEPLYQYIRDFCIKITKNNSS